MSKTFNEYRTASTTKPYNRVGMKHFRTTFGKGFTWEELLALTAEDIEFHIDDPSMLIRGPGRCREHFVLEAWDGNIWTTVKDIVPIGIEEKKGLPSRVCDECGADLDDSEYSIDHRCEACRARTVDRLQSITF